MMGEGNGVKEMKVEKESGLTNRKRNEGGSGDTRREKRMVLVIKSAVIAVIDVRARNLYGSMVEA